MKNKLVSIIMPAYNGERFIKQAIQSVIDQSYVNWELLIIDDGSTDGTAEKISTFYDPRIHYVYQINRGQAAALNHGLDLASGEYITTLDVDDWFTPNSLYDRAVFLDSNSSYDVVYGDGVFCDNDGKQLNLFSELRMGEVSGDVFDVLLSNSFFGTGANVMIRRSALERYEIQYDETIVWCQDYDLYLQLAAKCKFGFVNEIMVWYRIHQDNMTLTVPSGRRKESLVRTKYKALESARFTRTSIPRKSEFFWHLLVDDLDKNISRQMELIKHEQFQILPKYNRARLMRLCASSHLIANQNLGDVRELLWKSWILNPCDLKTVMIIILFYLNGTPIRWLFIMWRAKWLRRQMVPSPFKQMKR